MNLNWFTTLSTRTVNEAHFTYSRESRLADRVECPEAGKATEAAVVRGEDEPVLYRESRQLDVRDVVASQPGRRRKLCCDRAVFRRVALFQICASSAFHPRAGSWERRDPRSQPLAGPRASSPRIT